MLLDHTALTRVLSQLHNFGFILSMDDFGSGYSSLHMLSKLEYDVLKLVRSCCSISSRGSTIIRHIVSMAHDLNMKIVAEGIETKEQAAGLRCGTGLLFCPSHEHRQLRGVRIRICPPQRIISINTQKGTPCGMPFFILCF